MTPLQPTAVLPQACGCRGARSSCAAQAIAVGASAACYKLASADYQHHDCYCQQHQKQHVDCFIRQWPRHRYAWSASMRDAPTPGLCSGSLRTAVYATAVTTPSTGNEIVSVCNTTAAYAAAV